MNVSTWWSLHELHRRMKVLKFRILANALPSSRFTGLVFLTFFWTGGICQGISTHSFSCNLLFLRRKSGLLHRLFPELRGLEHRRRLFYRIYFSRQFWSWVHAQVIPCVMGPGARIGTATSIYIVTSTSRFATFSTLQRIMRPQLWSYIQWWSPMNQEADWVQNFRILANAQSLSLLRHTVSPSWWTYRYDDLSWVAQTDKSSTFGI